MIRVYFSYDRWLVVRRYGFRETLIAHRPSKREANQLAAAYRAAERSAA